MSEKDSVFIDEIIQRALDFSETLPEKTIFEKPISELADLNERLAGGQLRIAVLGQFNRGKSSFINTLLGLEVLPVSVLPITSVPTIIKHGEKEECTISFSDGKDDAIEKGSTEKIIELLSKFVSEKDNPKNEKCVSKVTVSSSSSFLNHGTVLIDTPGFGSTHIHNTETTVNMLSSCDAALFLLSADLPITKVEIEFLKKVIPAVPRIFFIYNKTDLLNKSELKETQEFIKNTLTRDLDFQTKPVLFPVSTKLAQKDKKKGGFSIVEKEIINFLLKEKYFTLSQALNSKLEESLDRIINTLNNQIEDILIPIKIKKEEIERLSTLLTSIENKKKNSEAAFLSEEENLDNIFRNNVDNHLKRLEVTTNKKLKEFILALGNLRPEHHNAINILISTFIYERVNRAAIEFSSVISRPLIHLAYRQIKNLKRTAENIFAKLDLLVEIDEMYDPLIKKATINSEEFTPPLPKIVLPKPEKPLFGRFTSNDKKVKLATAYYAKETSKLISTTFSIVTDFVASHSNKIYESFFDELRHNYENLATDISGRISETENLLKIQNESSQKPLSKLNTNRDNFLSVKELL